MNLSVRLKILFQVWMLPGESGSNWPKPDYIDD
jgi:hypothetical protein